MRTLVNNFFPLSQKDQLIRQLQLQTPQLAVTLATAYPMVSSWPAAARCSSAVLLPSLVAVCSLMLFAPCLGFHLAKVCPL